MSLRTPPAVTSAPPLRRPDPAPDRAGATTRQRSSWAAVAGIVFLASGLRFAMLGSNSLWFDEALIARVAQLRWQEIIPTLVVIDVHPPLYFLLMKAWVGLAGTSEAALRFPSALASVVSVLLTYCVMRRMAPERVSLLGALLAGVSPFAVMAGQEARMYALLEMLTLASTLAVILSVERGGAWRWAAYAVLAAAMIYTHYLGIIILAAHGLWIVWFNRAHLRAWLLATGGTIVLYGPWIPSLWHQSMVNELHYVWFRHPVGSADLTGLLGLLAFGGSLLGTSSFFAAGSLDPAVQWIVLLPFLFLVWRGMVAQSADRRDLALLGLCLGLPIGTMLLVSLIKPAFYARWFSFLAPFYAMFVAFGIVETARRVATRRVALLAALVVGVVSCSVPVFAQYYFDPGFRPYRWRDAAALVRAHAEPQDFILYIHHASAVAFGYYFREPHPSLTLTPVEAVGGLTDGPGFTVRQARELAARYRRVWLVIMGPFNERMRQRLFPPLHSAFQFGDVNYFGNVWVVRLEAKP
jgi:mannosyltransferase